MVLFLFAYSSFSNIIKNYQNFKNNSFFDLENLGLIKQRKLLNIIPILFISILFYSLSLHNMFLYIFIFIDFKYDSFYKFLPSSIRRILLYSIQKDSDNIYFIDSLFIPLFFQICNNVFSIQIYSKHYLILSIPSLF